MQHGSEGRSPTPADDHLLQPTGAAAHRGQAQAAQAAVSGGSQQPAVPQGPETEIWAGRISFKYFLGRICGWFVAVIVLSVIAYLLVSRTEWVTGRTATLVVLGITGLSGVLIIGGVLIRVLGTHYRLTSQRLFITRGLLSQAVDQTELIRVDDVRLFKTLFGRMFNVGNVTVLTTDASDRNIEIEGISAPDAVAESIRGRMRALRGRSVYVESL